MKNLAKPVSVFLLLLGLAGCEPRGQVTALPDGVQVPEDATVHNIFVGTTRARSTDGQVFGSERSSETAYARFAVSVPPVHETGQIEWPTDVPDPSLHFVVRDAALINGNSAFRQDLARELSQRSPSNRDIALFVHGYNSNFGEALYRFTQAHHDFGNNNVPVLFTWPSYGETVGYLYDRDSTLLARDNLVEFIKTLRDTSPRGVTLIAHSMGSFLMMEALRQLAMTEGPGALNGLNGVILMSPDINVQVFESQARAIGTLPQPFIIFSSKEDRALRASRALAGDERLGAVENIERVESLNVTVVDVTALSEAGSLNHLTAITSPEFINYVRRLNELDQSLDSDIAQNEGFSVVEVFDQAREITLAPFQN